MSTTRVLPLGIPLRRSDGAAFRFCAPLNSTAPAATIAQVTKMLLRISSPPSDEFLLFEVLSLGAQGKGMPGDATIPAMRRSSEYSSSVSGQIVSRVFF